MLRSGVKKGPSRPNRIVLLTVYPTFHDEPVEIGTFPWRMAVIFLRFFCDINSQAHFIQGPPVFSGHGLHDCCGRRDEEEGSQEPVVKLATDPWHACVPWGGAWLHETDGQHRAAGHPPCSWGKARPRGYMSGFALLSQSGAVGMETTWPLTEMFTRVNYIPPHVAVLLGILLPLLRCTGPCVSTGEQGKRGLTS